LYITGLTNKAHSDEDIHLFLKSSSTIATHLEIERSPAFLWVRYPSLVLAVQSQAFFHQQSLNGKTIMCRFELGFCQETGQRMFSRKSIHTTIIRRIQNRKSNQPPKIGNGNPHRPKTKGRDNKNKNKDKNNTNIAAVATYSAKSLLLGETEYPFPSGLYLSRLVGLLQQWPRDDPLVQLVSNTSPVINKYAKEISESMAMVDALERATKLCLGTSLTHKKKKERVHVRVYCVGDGKYPLTAAAMALSYPYANWEFISIDPLMEPIAINNNSDTDIDNNHHHHRLLQVSGMSQDYEIPPPPPMTNNDSSDDSSSPDNTNTNSSSSSSLLVEIVVACHSHAPLQEVWNRIRQAVAENKTTQSSTSSHRAIAITMACCANYSDLDQKPILDFHDYEVYSPKRHIKIYNDDC
jgi:hypothetical protein